MMRSMGGINPDHPRRPRRLAPSAARSLMMSAAQLG